MINKLFWFLSILKYKAEKTPTSQIVLTNLSVVIRVFASSMFFALYASGKLGFEALAICLFDLTFVFIYLIYFYEKDKLCKD